MNVQRARVPVPHRSACWRSVGRGGEFPILRCRACCPFPSAQSWAKGCQPAPPVRGFCQHRRARDGLQGTINLRLQGCDVASGLQPRRVPGCAGGGCSPRGLRRGWGAERGGRRDPAAGASGMLSHSPTLRSWACLSPPTGSAHLEPGSGARGSELGVPEIHR